MCMRRWGSDLELQVQHGLRHALLRRHLQLQLGPQPRADVVPVANGRQDRLDTKAQQVPDLPLRPECTWKDRRGVVTHLMRPVILPSVKILPTIMLPCAAQ
jgi:hypothetical protein